MHIVPLTMDRSIASLIWTELFVARINYLIYTVVPLVQTPLLPNNCVLIREVSCSKIEHRMYSWHLPRICVLFRGVSSLKSVIQERCYCTCICKVRSVFSSAWLCQQSSWNQNSSIVRRLSSVVCRPSSVVRRPSVRPSVASIISEVIAWITFKF